MSYQHTVIYPIAATGAQASLDLDPTIAPFQVSAVIVFNAGAAGTVQLQVTYDNFDSPTMTDAQATWVNVGTGVTGTTVAALTSPVTRLRVTISVALTGGTVTLRTIQGFSIN